MESIDALFKAVYDGDLAAARSLVSGDLTLARARNADTLTILQFARFMRHAAKKPEGIATRIPSARAPIPKLLP